MTPTEYAKVHFNSLKVMSDRASTAKTDEQFREAMGSCMQVLGYGLEEMATGLRAIYLLLDKIDKKSGLR